MQLDYDTVRDTSGGSMNVGVLDGLLYILSRCDDDAQITVNISFGTLAGPHDGTLGAGSRDGPIDGVVRRPPAPGAGGRQRLPVPHPCQRAAHRGRNAPAPWRRKATLDWQVQPDDPTQSFLELWLPPGAQEVEIEITPPGHAPLPPLRFGESRMWTNGMQQPCCALIYPRSVATGENGTCALLALSRTFSFEPGVVTAPSGRWRVTLSTRSGEAVVDAYIERDDVVGGAAAMRTSRTSRIRTT